MDSLFSEVDFMPNRMIVCSVSVFCIVLAAATASGGTAGSWTLRSTGHILNTPSTALAMRDGLTWPVIFAPESNMVKAISLFPATNPQTQTGWYEIGRNLLPFSSSLPRIYAASSSNGKIAAACKYDPQTGSALTASSRSGITPFAWKQLCGGL